MKKKFFFPILDLSLLFILVKESKKPADTLIHEPLPSAKAG